MQYPVPQFTEVEDKLIGPLSIKQFFILFLAGIFIFAGYAATKSVFAIIVLFLIFGLPALGLAFVKINGRSAYLQIPFLIQFFSAPKKLVFHKEAGNFSAHTKLKDVKLATEQEKPLPAQGSTKERLKEVQVLLRKQQEEEEQLVGKIR